MKNKDVVGRDFAALIEIDYVEIHVLEYSSNQNQFHIQRLLDSLASNQRHVAETPHNVPDYVPIFIGTFEQCNKRASELAGVTWKNILLSDNDLPHNEAIHLASRKIQ